MNGQKKMKLTINVDKEMKELAEEVFEKLGLKIDVAINVYLYQVFYTQSIPFRIALPPEEMMARLELYQKICAGLKDVEAGRVIPGEQVMAELCEKFGVVQDDKKI
ncbi:MAG: type II toxin-antitoxin system RelB/DinJ family antitoxin [Lachnospiraceae bacterium]|nr:type II toxin-antitoxin system RelB/DinJ family antitoxin [Lachnospiraceae bacterium]MCM1237580.1 type II toxin-antitoxin system RelB/DinJ family antitoxin [Ruminococcus flavefaciens]